MDDWYKKHFELFNSVSRAIDQFKRFDELYGNSFQGIAKDIFAKEEIIKKSITPFYSSYTDIISSFKPEIEKIRELQLSNPILDSLNQANSSLATLFSEQSSLAKLVEETASMNCLWKTKLESAKLLTSGMDAAGSLTLYSHFDNIAQASLLAQKRLLNFPGENLERRIFYKSHEFPVALDSFSTFTQSYESLIQSFNNEKFNIVDFPPFVSRLPPVEILTSSDLLYSISRDETEDYVDEADDLEIEIREDIESSLEELLGYINPEIIRLWQGAKEAVSSTNPDKKRHVVVSLREMLTHILHGIAPDSEVSKWTTNPIHYYEGRPTRKARLLYICRDINHGSFEQFVSKDVEAHIKFIRLFQRGTHEIDINFTEQQLRTLVVRTEALSRFLLITWKDTK